jgi:hypothetical protein
MKQVYRRKERYEVEPWKEGADMAHVHSEVGRRPEPGDHIITNPLNADDKWLVSENVFKELYEPADG